MKRDLQLDGIRGIFLLIMAIDHFEGPLRKIFYEKIGFFTAAEGFVFLSGFVVGMVYGKISSRKELLHKSFKRVLVIYRYQLITFLLLFVLVLFVPYYGDFWHAHVPAYFDSPVSAFISSLLLAYVPNPVDILPMYVFFMVLMPFMILLLKENKTVTFFLVTIALYIVGQFLTTGPFPLIVNSHRITTIDFGFFNYLSWQILFFAGIYLGYMKRQLQRFFIPYNNTLTIASGVVCGLFFVWRLLFLLDVQGWLTAMDLNVYRVLFNKANLGVLRIMNFLCFCYLTASLLNYKKNYLTYRPLVFLGQHSIQAFTYHIVTYILFFPLYDMISTMNPVISIVYSLSMLALMYLALLANNRVKEIWAKTRSI